MTVTSRDHGLSDIGFAILPSVLSKSECHAVDNFLASMTIASAGSRNLLDKQWCSELGEQLRSRSILETSIGDNIAVQCTFSTKALP